MVILNKLSVLVIAVICSIGSIFAILTPGNSSTSVVDSGRLTEITAGDVTAVGGNVTNVNIAINTSTSKWQGFYGNVSGAVNLGSGNDVFYNFGSALFSTVLVTQGTDIDWSSLAAGAPGDVDTAWGFTTATDVDQAVDVFTTSSGTFAGIASTPNATSSGFNFGILNDGATTKTDHVFAAEIVNGAGQAGFDGNNYNYHIMVPVNPAAAETYYFYASLE